MHVLHGLWDKAKKPRENPCWRRENVQIAHRKAPASQWIQIQDLLAANSTYESTVLGRASYAYVIFSENVSGSTFK